MKGHTRVSPHIVYVWRDADGGVVYVGCSAIFNYSERVNTHRRSAWWYDPSLCVAVDSEQPSYAHGRLREAELIRDLEPAANRYGGHIAWWQASVKRTLAGFA